MKSSIHDFEMFAIINSCDFEDILWSQTQLYFLWMILRYTGIFYSKQTKMTINFEIHVQIKLNL